jgi:hypothetical protein
MKIIACLMLVAMAGCVTPDQPRPKYDDPYPIKEMIDPATGKPPVLR